jgi:hypothetical protein
VPAARPGLARVEPPGNGPPGAPCRRRAGAASGPSAWCVPRVSCRRPWRGCRALGLVRRGNGLRAGANNCGPVAPPVWGCVLGRTRGTGGAGRRVRSTRPARQGGCGAILEGSGLGGYAPPLVLAAGQVAARLHGAPSVEFAAPEAAHAIVDLGRRTLPVLGGEAVEITAGGLRSQ